MPFISDPSTQLGGAGGLNWARRAPFGEEQDPALATILWRAEMTRGMIGQEGWVSTTAGAGTSTMGPGEENHPGIWAGTAPAGNFQNRVNIRRDNKGITLATYDFEFAFLVSATVEWQTAAVDIGAYWFGLDDINAGPGTPSVLIGQDGGRSTGSTNWVLQTNEAGPGQNFYDTGVSLTPDEWRWFLLNASAGGELVEVRTATTWADLFLPASLVISEDLSAAGDGWPDDATDLMGASIQINRAVIDGTNDATLKVDYTHGIARNIAR